MMNQILKKQFLNTYEYVLDEENILVIFNNGKEEYTVIHYRKQEDEMIEVNR